MCARNHGVLHFARHTPTHPLFMVVAKAVKTPDKLCEAARITTILLPLLYSQLGGNPFSTVRSPPLTPETVAFTPLKLGVYIT